MSPAAKVLVLSDEAHLVVEKAKQKFSTDEFNIFIGSPDPYFIEFLRPDVSKGSGLVKLCAHLNIDIQQVVAFGDGNNDQEMLTFAGIGVAMKNATPTAKAAADVVLEVSLYVHIITLKDVELLLYGTTATLVSYFQLRRINSCLFCRHSHICSGRTMRTAWHGTWSTWKRRVIFENIYWVLLYHGNWKWCEIVSMFTARSAHFQKVYSFLRKKVKTTFIYATIYACTAKLLFKYVYVQLWQLKNLTTTRNSQHEKGRKN